jgi:hypothetical protein
LVDPPGQSATPYSFDFLATGAFPIYLTVQAYQVPAFMQVTNNVVSDSLGDAQLLSPTWAFFPAAQGSDTSQYSDGSGVNALSFGAVTPPYLDTYQQSFASTVGGESFDYSFDFSNDGGTPSYLRITVSTSPSFSGVGGVPEPSTWAMMVLGFAGLGFAGYRSRKAASLPA